MADLATNPGLSRTELHEILTAKDWFHVMFVETEDLEVTGGKNSSRIFAIFLNQDKSRTRMCAHEGEHERGTYKELVEYAWRSSIVQLMPDFRVANSGGLSAYYAIDGGGLEIRAHDDTEGQNEKPRIGVDLEKRMVDIKGLEMRRAQALPNLAEDNTGGHGERAATSKMQLIALKCYRLPGFATYVINWFPKDKPFDDLASENRSI